MPLVLGFALLGGAVLLLTSAITGASFGDVIKGNAGQLYREHQQVHDQAAVGAAVNSGIATGIGASVGAHLGGWAFPFTTAFGWGRTDQGVDFTGAGPIRALGSGIIVRADPQKSGTGWPGATGKGTGSMIVLKLDQAPPVAGASRYVYLAENVDPKVTVNQRVNAGDIIASARGAYPYLEIGFAQDAHGTPLTPYNASDYEQATPGGGLFRRWLNELAGGQHGSGPH